MPNEKKTDHIIGQLLLNANIEYTPNGSDIKEIEEALKSSSKRGTGKQGYPEFVAKVNDFILVIEDKAELEKQAKYMNDKKDTLLMDTESITNYAENGALHYALHIIKNTSFKKIIAFGCSGIEKDRIKIRPIYVSPTGYKIMPIVKDFQWFNLDNILKYYNEKICGNKPI